MAAARVFLVGGVISYRALFNWIRPLSYATTMLGIPLFQLLFFAYVGRFAGVRDDAFFVVGNAVQATAMGGLYAMTMTVANERFFGTLAPVLATPANRLALFLGRALPVVLNALAVSAVAFAAGLLLLDFSLPAARVPALAAVVLVTATATTGLGLLLGSLGLRVRDVLFASNLVYFGTLLVCGVNVPLDVLPPWLQAVGRALPLTHGVEAARRVAGGEGLGGVDGLLATEAGIGAAYALVAFALFRVFELEGRRRASLETY
ncbi:MAG: ABC transporter permease [Thermoleophilia bacterium]|nr:ABC transporter permease [Thermoleophilia bacterium]